jgi:hypothetical protein
LVPSAALEELELPIAPIQSVLSVKYVDANGVERTLDPALYQVDRESWTPRLRPASGKAWPVTQWGAMGAVKIRVLAGYPGITAESSGGSSGSSSSDGSIAEPQVPTPIQQAVLLTVSDWYGRRGLGSAIGDVKSETIGDYSYTLGGNAGSVQVLGLPEVAMALVNPYRRLTS